MKEIIKWLDAGIIYPIYVSVWVSIIQCVPNKGGMIVIKNEKNELIPSGIVTDWRICMTIIENEKTELIPTRIVITKLLEQYHAQYLSLTRTYILIISITI